nr:hypothetical protein [Nitrosomonas nitrosa]
MSSSAYSPIKHLAHALFFKHDENAHYFAMLTGYTGYFDAAGQRGQGKMLTVGGYIASVTRWDRFNEQWGKILEKRSIEAFHMADFMHSESIDGKWKKDDGSAENFLMKLASATCTAAEYMVLATVYLDDWEQLNQRYELRETGLTPFALAGVSCIELVHRWCNKRKIPRTQIEFIFENGDLDRGHLWDIAKKHLGVQIVPRSKSLRPLQACDLLAWDAQRAEKTFMRSTDKDKFELSGIAKQMLSRIKHNAIICQSSNLDRLCKHLHVACR